MKKGEFYKDLVNHDLLKILDFNAHHRRTVVTDMKDGKETGAHEEESPILTEYVKCLCIANGEPFGIQEMKSANLNTPRYRLATGLTKVWLRWKYRDSKINMPKAPVNKGLAQ